MCPLWSRERLAEVELCLNMHTGEPGIFWEGLSEGRGRWP